ncbi:Maf family protein [Dermatobacter hominis]|uniref:Maf family protein n=1 Tax=Dermatobacter hominis TaxID=2884263 RepID=UPI001D126147|nr:Maf family protein [Dermatobacter hominis]UDY36353.1 Maf family protein [Dermatobacter hominis]
MSSAPQDGPLVLASGSRYRAALLAEAGIEVAIDPPDVDERAFDVLLERLGPDGLAVELALRKALDVAPRHPGRTVVAADQVGVLPTGGGVELLTKRPTVEGAVAQLVAMSGTTHRLVNGVVVIGPGGTWHSGVDVQVVTMRSYTEDEARAYVERFEPFDTSGSYRLEDGDVLVREGGPGAALVASVAGEHASGVVGLPLPLLRRLLADAAAPGFSPREP